MSKPKSMPAAVPAVKKVENLPAQVEDFSAYAGEGFENVSAKDILIPRLTIIQALSPQINPQKPEFIKEAKIGDIVDVGTGELMPSPVIFLPVYFTKSYLEWAPRASGKGLQGIHPDASIMDKTKPDAKGKAVLPNGNNIVETSQFFGLNLSMDGRRSFIPMASTQLKKAKRWLTLATGEKLTRSDGSTYTPPLFYRSYVLTSIPESNNEGSWNGWKIERHVALPDMDGWKGLLEDAKSFREALIAGEAKADVASMDDHAGSSTESEVM